MSEAATHLAIEVRFFDGRYHGLPEWPPSPGRLFQALIAASADPGAQTDAPAALEWLETLGPPVVVSPRSRRGGDTVFYVPNNDLDAQGGDPALVGEIRVAKRQSQRLFDASIPLAYAWPLDESANDAERHLAVLRDLAERVYQFGRGIDPAWAVADTWTAATLAARARQPGVEVWRPGGHRGRGPLLDVPAPGSLASLETRYGVQRSRLSVVGSGKAAQLVLEQAPRPRFAGVEYGSGPHPLVVALRPTDVTRARHAAFEPWPLSRAHDLVVAVRDAAHDRLAASLPRAADDVRRQLVGRRPDDDDALPRDQRVRIVPLPSIGSQFADRVIRRVLVMIPDHGPVAHADLAWAFTGLEIMTPSGASATLERADGDTMVRHYGVDKAMGRRRWRSVTPMAVPRARSGSGRRDGTTQASLIDEVRSGIADALRHADVDARALSIRPTREPPDQRGTIARDFAVPPRFAADRLWHVEIEFDRPCAGPLVIGDGRYLGLGVLAPETVPAMRALVVTGGLEDDHADAEGLALAFRRALLATAQEVVGANELPESLTGHRRDGRPARGHAHVHIAWDPRRRRFIVLPPPRRDDAALIDEALARITTLRAGSAGRLDLMTASIGDDDPLILPAMRWRSLTRYTVGRHERRGDAELAIAADVRRECRRSDLPVPRDVAVSDIRARNGRPLSAHVELAFDVAVGGPLLLGRTRHRGGGLFEARPRPS